jgi:hypothetical protein
MMIFTGIYRHYKGGLYLVLGVSQISGTEDDPQAQRYVVYVPLYTHKGAALILRPVEEFDEMVGTEQRFKYLGDVL